MIHNKNFPFDGEEREIVHVSPRNSNVKRIGIKIVALSLLFASLMFGAKYAYDLGRGTKDFTTAPLVMAKNEPYKKAPEEPGGMKIPFFDKEIYKNLNPAFIDSDDDATPMPAPEKPMQIDAMASLIEDNFASDFDPIEPTFDNYSGDVKEDSIRIPPPPQIDKPKTFKLGADGKLTQASKSSPIIMENSKKIDITKILAKRNEEEIWIQLGTFPNEQEATKAWQNVRENNGDILGDSKTKITKSDLGDNGIFYRLQSGPLNSESDAREICKAMNEREQNCFFVKQAPKN